MATIRKRGASWQVQVRQDGHPPLSKTFQLRSVAATWARETERRIERGELHGSDATKKRITVGDALRRYETVITPTKRGARSEASRIKTLLSYPISKVAVAKLSPAIVAQYRDERLQLVKADSIRRELGILGHCIEVGRREWDLPLFVNPVRQIVLPSPGKGRSMRLDETDARQLTEALNRTRAWYLAPVIALAVETGMRRSELLSLKWSNINLAAGTAHLEVTKNGHQRTIVLTPAAATIIKALTHRADRLFPISANALRLSWERLRTKAGITNLRFHDLRHEAISRFFEMGLTIPEVALISGHRDYRMLARYTHLKPETVALKVAALSRTSTTSSE